MVSVTWPHIDSCALSNCVYDYAPNECCECTCRDVCEMCHSNFFLKSTPDPAKTWCRWCYNREKERLKSQEF